MHLWGDTYTVVEAMKNGKRIQGEKRDALGAAVQEVHWHLVCMLFDHCSSDDRMIVTGVGRIEVFRAC
jgi:hypothetical protein